MNKIIVAAVVAASVAIFYIFFKKRHISGYLFMGSPFAPLRAGSGREYNEECLEHPGYRFCTLTDGSAGVCGTSGVCVADLSTDRSRDSLNNGRDDFYSPVCLEPVFKEGCHRYCNCQLMKEDSPMLQDYEGCIESCEKMFYPI